MTRREGIDREGALELLRQGHAFPGDYLFRVVVRPDLRARIISAVSAAVQSAGAVRRVEEQPSSKGTYVSLRLHVHVHTPEVVLDVYEVLGGIDGVLATL